MRLRVGRYTSLFMLIYHYFLFLVHPIAPSASDEPFFIFPFAHCTSESGHGRTDKPEKSQTARASQTIPPTPPDTTPLLPPRTPTKSPICADSENDKPQLIQQTRHFIQRPSKSFAPHRRLPTFALSSRQQRNTNQK